MKVNWKSPMIWAPFIIILVALGSLPFFLDDSDNQDKHGKKPYELVIQFENALQQMDGVTINKISTESTAKETAWALDISLQQGKQNNKTIPDNWVMEEYQLDENTYFYHISWVDDTVGKVGGFYKVEKQNDEWKIELIERNELENIVQGLTPEVIRGLQEKQ